MINRLKDILYSNLKPILVSVLTLSIVIFIAPKTDYSAEILAIGLRYGIAFSIGVLSLTLAVSSYIMKKHHDISDQNIGLVFLKGISAGSYVNFFIWVFVQVGLLFSIQAAGSLIYSVYQSIFLIAIFLCTFIMTILVFRAIMMVVSEGIRSFKDFRKKLRLINLMKDEDNGKTSDVFDAFLGILIVSVLFGCFYVNETNGTAPIIYPIIISLLSITLPLIGVKMGFKEKYTQWRKVGFKAEITAKLVFVFFNYLVIVLLFQQEIIPHISAKGIFSLKIIHLFVAVMFGMTLGVVIQKKEILVHFLVRKIDSHRFLQRFTEFISIIVSVFFISAVLISIYGLTGIYGLGVCVLSFLTESIFQQVFDAFSSETNASIQFKHLRRWRKKQLIFKK